MRAMAAATDLPVIVYDIPVRTGRKIATATCCAWPVRCRTSSASRTPPAIRARRPPLVGQRPRRLRGLQRRRRDDPAAAGGGAVGVIGVATHWTAEDHQRDDRPLGQGRHRRRPAVNARLLESFAYETGDDAPNPMPTKVMMSQLGLPVGECPPADGPAPAGWPGSAREVIARPATAGATAWPRAIAT